MLFIANISNDTILLGYVYNFFSILFLSKATPRGGGLKAEAKWWGIANVVHLSTIGPHLSFGVC